MQILRSNHYLNLIWPKVLSKIIQETKLKEDNQYPSRSNQGSHWGIKQHLEWLEVALINKLLLEFNQGF